MNNKGFSLVELLAVVAILSILSGIAIGAATRYQEKAKQQGYDTLVESAKLAAENYVMDHPSTTSVNFDTLVKEGYLENAIDPGTKNSDCTGTVRVVKGEKGTASKITQNDYTVDICCVNYTYSIGKDSKEKIPTSSCMADYSPEKYVEPSETQEANCASGGINTRNFYFYTMNSKSKVCSKDSNGNYGDCNDGEGNYPCRIYDYYRRQCYCDYSKTTKKLCGSRVVTPSSDSWHPMRIRYLDNKNGKDACESEAPGSFNSYVQKVCKYGTYENYPYKSQSDVMVFHGYLFFKGQSEGFTNFQPNGSWFHDPLTNTTDGKDYLDVRVARSNDVNNQPNFEQGCYDMCVRFTEALSGKVD